MLLRHFLPQSTLRLASGFRRLVIGTYLGIALLGTHSHFKMSSSVGTFLARFKYWFCLIIR